MNFEQSKLPMQNHRTKPKGNPNVKPKNTQKDYSKERASKREGI